MAQTTHETNSLEADRTQQKGGVAQAAGGTPAGVTPPAQSPPPSPPPPRGPGLLTILVVLAVGGLMLWVGVKWGDWIRSGYSGARQVLVGQRDQAADAPAEKGARALYTCSMHPWVLQPEPGLCPICHMDLVPVDPEKFTGRLEIDPVVLQNIGVRIAPVTTGPVTRTVRTVGTVDYNETVVRDVNIKLSGWIEKLHVNYMGERVEEGQPLLELYAPDLYAAQQEYLLAYRRRQGASATQPNPLAGTQDVLKAARTRLEYYDISDEQIRELEQRGEASKTMMLYSPHSGVVIEKEAYEGMRVEPGMRLFRIADLSSVWVMVTLYEYQLPFVQVGQKAIMTLPYIPGQTFEGKVIYIYPTLDEKTRQVRVRLEFPNEQGLLKPGMFAEVQLHSTLAEDRILAPREAIIDTGRRQVAFVSLGEGKFEPRDVQIGVQTQDGRVQVLAGLKPGEMVVTSGQFLLDSESRVRESLAKMIRGELAAEQQAVVATAEPAGDLIELPPAANEALAGLLDAYFAVAQKLAGDTLEGVAPAARQIAASANDLMQVPVPDDEHFWHRHEEVATVRGEALELVGQTDMAAARLAFADLSVALANFLRATGVPSSYGQQVQQLHCPMYREGQGGSTWLQPAGPVRNPFYGKMMLECYDERFVLPVAGKGPATQTQPEGSLSSAEPRPASPAGMRSSAREGAHDGHDNNCSEPPRNSARGDSEGHEHGRIDGYLEQASTDPFVAAYLRIHDVLAKDDLPAAQKAVAPLRDSAEALAKAAAGQNKALAAKVAEGAAKLTQAGDIEAFRETFAVLSVPAIDLVRQSPPSAEVAPTLLHIYCPMVRKHWLQRDEDFRNPYATYMLECGGIEGRIQARRTEGR